jgi:formylglycine-generating enzyme required for sulfatase activity
LGLVETVTRLRKGHGLAPGEKVLVVIDQFEQWLHGRQERTDEELILALRQCDGEHVQGLVMVRDDFWMATTRFMRELEIHLVEGQNSAAVDLFSLKHARRVLASFGRAFGVLPEDRAELNPEQERFLDQVIAGLAQDGKVIPVRLALFAEMVKGRSWTPATLKEVGGAEGIGVTFLEETFSASSAPPEHRLHQRAAQAVLKALLPERGADIKGHMRSYDELLHASGYSRRPRDFDDLLCILDADLRLITPTDAEAKEEGERTKHEEKSQSPDSSFIPPPSSLRYFQLTHDYLVPALEQWLTRKQRESWRGRAQLRLAERAALWSVRPESRHLPALWEWANILLFTRRQNWSGPQQHMMRRATWRYTRQVAGVVLLFGLLAGGTWYGIGAMKASALVDRLMSAEVREVPGIVAQLGPYRRWAHTRLKEQSTEGAADSRERLNASLALLPVDPGQRDYLYQRLLMAGPVELPVIREALGGHSGDLRERLWAVLEDTGHDADQRFRAACALADYEPDSPRWSKVARDVTNKLVTENPLALGAWTESLSLARGALVQPLADLCRDTNRSVSDRSVAANLLARYAAGQTDLLAELIKDVEPRFGAVFLPVLQVDVDKAIAQMEREFPGETDLAAPQAGLDNRARRQANAAAVLFYLGRPDRVWPLLRHSRDPSRRTYLVHCLGPLGMEPLPLIRRLETEQEVSTRRALILSLGEFPEEKLPAGERLLLSEKLMSWYRDDPDPGTHSAIDWLLRRWKQNAKSETKPTKERGQGEPSWYVNGQGQTFAILPGPLEFKLGSPPDEPGRNAGLEGWQDRRIDRSLAIATKEVTVRQFKQFLDANPEVSKDSLRISQRYSYDPDGPIVGVLWFEAAQYCRWLTQKEGLAEDQMCYPAVAEIQKRVFAKNPEERGIRLPANCLQRIGYRLPTEAEWEYACRAGAVTSQAFGNSRTMLDHYGWHLANAQARAHPVGLLKPNDFGLFDMYGNANEWTHDKLLSDAPAVAPEVPEEERSIIWNQNFMLYRGGSASNLPGDLRSAQRFRSQLMNREAFLGFRVVRTQR